jgi:hypothetical protein
MMTRKAAAVVSMSVFFALALPGVSFAATLTGGQVSAIVGLLEAFGVDPATIGRVEGLLGASVATAVSATSTDSSATTTPAAPHVPVVGSAYPSSAIGYDLSFGTQSYPATYFGFGVVGATSGKAFTHNARIATEYSWAQMASAARPTMYLNVNAPYGSTVAGHAASPKDCTNATATPASGFAQTTASAGTSAYPEPSTCAAYNYGWNAAKDAYDYAASMKVPAATFWWLDIEEANSWSANPAVNDATIQGALDYLNSTGVKVGIYSMPFMWKEIAGTSFVPKETVNGTAFAVPTWFPIGINTQIGALNACNTKTSFIPGSPIWILQYELDHTAIDQNVAC